MVSADLKLFRLHKKLYLKLIFLYLYFIEHVPMQQSYNLLKINWTLRNLSTLELREL